MFHMPGARNSIKDCRCAESDQCKKLFSMPKMEIISNTFERNLFINAHHLAHTRSTWRHTLGRFTSVSVDIGGGL